MWDGRPSKEESVALRREARIDVDLIAGDHHAVVRIGHCWNGVEPSRRRDKHRVTVVRRGSVCTCRCTQHAFSVLIGAATPAFRALRGTTINGDPES